MENQARRVSVELTAEDYRQIEQRVSEPEAQAQALLSALLLQLGVKFSAFVAENGLQDFSIDVHIDRPKPEAVDEDTTEEIVAGFRQAWHEAMTGDTRPVSELWDGLDNE